MFLYQMKILHSNIVTIFSVILQSFFRRTRECMNDLSNENFFILQEWKQDFQYFFNENFNWNYSSYLTMKSKTCILYNRCNWFFPSKFELNVCTHRIKSLFRFIIVLLNQNVVFFNYLTSKICWKINKRYTVSHFPMYLNILVLQVFLSLLLHNLNEKFQAAP